MISMWLVLYYVWISVTRLLPFLGDSRMIHWGRGRGRATVPEMSEVSTLDLRCQRSGRGAIEDVLRLARGRWCITSTRTGDPSYHCTVTPETKSYLWNVQPSTLLLCLFAVRCFAYTDDLTDFIE
ncbi:hypothetical protein VNO78_03407 [Psophocarpus tetragonolobus]|uniref:Secreted protein n=1 Tax=Psophocarpus tetragonolobus TaxID=3891 RepID=A0AAN9XWM5_PSOTE